MSGSLPGRRRNLIVKVKVVRPAPLRPLKLFILVEEYPDGSFGGLSVEVAKEGELLSALLNCFCQVVSLAVQHGLPLERLVDTFTFTRFEPAGPVLGHSRIKFCTSILDLVFRHLGVEYLGRDDLAHVPREGDC